ncbi:hypothetical protein ACFPT7_01310 [Acidicapsa dinghuensis]|uniref:Uncharacterized protein n=1 Tax=Acidicapsa dinghuensis TaxID=2218256 RepID=A0ABW1E9L2_9BACT|nr:hypothetical protein [Acidicapsa dinghuensis]
MECALDGLFDYAGMFPPAERDLRTALHEYLAHRHENHACALGCMVVDVNTLTVLQSEARDKIHDLQLSVIATSENLEMVRHYLKEGLPIGMVEIKAADRGKIMHLKEHLPKDVSAYVEVSVEFRDASILDAINEAGLRAKLRMGGVVAEAFPSAASVAAMLKMLAERRMAFKATAGLHHPLRSRHRFTYQPNSDSGLMHGFINLLCASALLWFGGDIHEATQLLEEQSPQAFRITADAIRWRSWEWSANQLREVRERFLMSIGSCSFTEPIRDLEAFGWL